MDSTRTDEQRSAQTRRLGDILREARLAKGLELADVSEVTHVRQEYLKALDEGRYQDLPEDVYARNFVRLYGQTVGLDEDKLLQKYKQERYPDKPAAEPAAAGRATGRQSVRQPALATSAGATGRAGPGQPANATPRRTNPNVDPDFWRDDPTRKNSSLLLWLLGLLLLIAALGLAWWAFVGRTQNTPPPPAVTEPATTDPAGTDPAGTDIVPTPPAQAPAVTDAPPLGVPAEPEPVSGNTVLFSLNSTPAGAEVTVNGFYLGNTPLQNVPILARDSGTVQVRLDGYETAEFSAPLVANYSQSVTLSPAGSGQAASLQQQTPLSSSQGNIVIQVDATSWLEVYSGTARNQGQRLAYLTAPPGWRQEFPLPVYVHVGNAGGVRVSVNGEDRGRIGATGQVTGQLFQ